MPACTQILDKRQQNVGRGQLVRRIDVGVSSDKVNKVIGRFHDFGPSVLDGIYIALKECAVKEDTVRCN